MRQSEHAERLNGRVLSWMLGLACRLSYLGGGRSCGERRSDAFITFECGRSGQNRASRRARRRRGRREIGNAHQAARAAQGRSGSEPKEDGDEQSHEFFNENDNRSRQTEAKGREPVHRRAMIGSRPCAPERSGRGGAIDTQMPWNYMRDHVNLRAWLSLRRRQECGEEKSDGRTTNFLISSFPAAAGTVLVLSNATSAIFAPSWQMTSTKPNQVQSVIRARDEQRSENCERRRGGQWRQIRRNSKPGAHGEKKAGRCMLQHHWF